MMVVDAVTFARHLVDAICDSIEGGVVDEASRVVAADEVVRAVRERDEVVAAADLATREAAYAREVMLRAAVDEVRALEHLRREKAAAAEERALRAGDAVSSVAEVLGLRRDAPFKTILECVVRLTGARTSSDACCCILLGGPHEAVRGPLHARACPLHDKEAA